MASYQHRPQPSGLHAKLRNELSAASAYVIGARGGHPPNHITVRYDRAHSCRHAVVWAGHRDLMPSLYRGAQDPYSLLSRPASD